MRDGGRKQLAYVLALDCVERCVFIALEGSKGREDGKHSRHDQDKTAEGVHTGGGGWRSVFPIEVLL